MSGSNAEVFARKFFEASEYMAAEAGLTEEMRTWEMLSSVEQTLLMSTAVGVLPWIRDVFAKAVEAQAENCYSDDLGDSARKAYEHAGEVIRNLHL